MGGNLTHFTCRLNDLLHFMERLVISFNNMSLADTGIFWLSQCKQCWYPRVLFHRNCFHNQPKYIISCYALWVLLVWCNWKVCIIKLWCLSIRISLSAGLLRQHRSIPPFYTVHVWTMFQQRLEQFCRGIISWVVLSATLTNKPQALYNKHHDKSQVKTYRMKQRRSL